MEQTENHDTSDWLGRVQRTRRWVVRAFPFLLLMGLALYVLSGFYTIEPNQVGVVKRFGRIVAPSVPPGPHYRLPWPVEAVETVDVREVKRLETGFWPDKPELFSRTPDAGSEAESITLGCYALTGDRNLIHVTAAVQYKIVDAAGYLDKTAASEKTLALVVDACLLRTVAQYEVDGALTDDKPKIRARVSQLANGRLKDMDIPLQITSLELTRMEPPEEVSFAFRDVINADNERTTRIHEAQASANQTRWEAEAQREKLLQETEAYCVRVQEHAHGEAERFTDIYQKYREAKDITRKRLYLEMAQRVFPKIKKIIMPRGNENRAARVKVITGR